MAKKKTLRELDSTIERLKREIEIKKLRSDLKKGKGGKK